MGNHQGLRLRAARLAAAADALNRRSGAAGARAPFSLVFMTDASRVPNPLLIARVLPRGSAVILRDYAMPKRTALAARLKSVCAARGVKLLIGADSALAARIGADGVHAPRWWTPETPLARGALLSASCHDEKSLARAGEMGAALALLSPAFATASHPGAQALGAEKFRALAVSASMPVLALGGVDETNAHRLAGPNVAGLAAISAFLK